MRSLVTISLIVLNSACFSQASKPVVIGYVGGYNALVIASDIAADKLTHINYAFVDIKNNRAWLHNERTDTTNFRILNQLKQVNPALKILISIGGWTWSKNFSDAVFTESTRREFAASALDIISTHHLDGIDIDWEYPNMRGDGNTFRPQDKANYTLMFAELRRQLDSLTMITKKKYCLTTAAGAFKSFLDNTEMEKAQQYLDYINLMTYDYSWNMATHHTNLYTWNDNESSADKAYKDFLNAGVPSAKLVMGLAFYGKGGYTSDTSSNGFGQKLTRSKSGGGFSYIKDSLVNKNGFLRYWDARANAPFLFNAKTKQFITYDDELSVAAKCEYVLSNKMGGVMFWEYSSDPKLYLLNIVDQIFSAVEISKKVQ